MDLDQENGWGRKLFYWYRLFLGLPICLPSCEIIELVSCKPEPWKISLFRELKYGLCKCVMNMHIVIIYSKCKMYNGLAINLALWIILWKWKHKGGLSQTNTRSEPRIQRMCTYTYCEHYSEYLTVFIWFQARFAGEAVMRNICCSNILSGILTFLIVLDLFNKKIKKKIKNIFQSITVHHDAVICTK